MALVVTDKLQVSNYAPYLSLIQNHSTVQSENNVGDWLSFLSILSTLLAAFFIYSSWKIDNDLKAIEKKSEDMRKKHEETNKEMDREVNSARFYAKINYGLFFLNTKQYGKCVDYLVDIKNNTRDKSETYTCLMYIGQAYYLRYNDTKKEEDLAQAYIALSEAKELLPEYFDDEILLKEIYQILSPN